LFSVDDVLAEREERNPTEVEYVGMKRMKGQDLEGDVDMWDSQLSQPTREKVEEADCGMLFDDLDEEELKTSQDEELGILELLEEEEELLNSPVTVSLDCESECSGQLDSQRMFELRRRMV
jgi:hypothetical protein